MENQTSSIESLWDRVKSYLETRTELIKLKAIDKISSIASSVGSLIIVVMIGIIFLSLLNIGIALWLGELLGKVYYGFFVLAGFYGIIGLVLYSSREKIIKTPIINSMVKKLHA